MEIDSSEITNNKELIKKTGSAYCLYCIDFKKIKFENINFNIINNECTAICPICKIDCMIRSDYDSNLTTLKKIHEYLFE